MWQRSKISQEGGGTILLWSLALCSLALTDDWESPFPRYHPWGPSSCNPSGSLPLVGLHLESSHSPGLSPCAGFEKAAVHSSSPTRLHQVPGKHSCILYDEKSDLLVLPSSGLHYQVKATHSPFLYSTSPQGPVPSSPCLHPTRPQTRPLETPPIIQWRKEHPVLEWVGSQCTNNSRGEEVLTSTSVWLKGPKNCTANSGLFLIFVFPLEGLQVMIWYLSIFFSFQILMWTPSTGECQLFVPPTYFLVFLGWY